MLALISSKLIQKLRDALPGARDAVLETWRRPWAPRIKNEDLYLDVHGVLRNHGVMRALCVTKQTLLGKRKLQHRPTHRWIPPSPDVSEFEIFVRPLEKEAGDRLSGAAAVLARGLEDVSSEENRLEVSELGLSFLQGLYLR